MGATTKILTDARPPQPIPASGITAGSPASRDRWLLMRLFAAGNSSPRIAENLIGEHGSLGAVLSTSDERLQQLGADSNGIAMLQLIREAIGSVLERRAGIGQPIRSSRQLADRLHAEMAWLTVEQVRAAFLDAAHCLLRIEVVGSGTLDKAHVYPRELARRALELSASAVILAHNHPSGDCAPSDADIGITGKINRALAAIDVQLVDHLIIARSRIISMAASGLI